MCLLGTIATGVETLRTRIKYNMDRGASEFCSEWTLADNGNNGFVRMGNITDMNGMVAFLGTDEEMKRIEREAHQKIVSLSNICINEFREVQKQIREVRAEMHQLKNANGVLHAFVDKNMHALEAAVKVNRNLASPWCKTDDAVGGLVEENANVKDARTYFATVHQ